MRKPDPATAEDAARLKAIMRRRDGLFPLIMDFAVRPSRYMHESWAEMLFTPELWGRLRQSCRAAPHIDRLILRDLGIDGSLPVDFDGPAALLALLDGAALDRLCLNLGLVADGAAVRRAITADAVSKLREALGADNHAFAVQRAPLLASLHRPADVAPADAAPASQALPDRLRAAGKATLGTAMAGLPDAILRRFRLKLPYGDTTDFTPSSRSAGAAALAIRVLKETEPRWASLFATPSM